MDVGFNGGMGMVCRSGVFENWPGGGGARGGGDGEDRLRLGW